MKNHYESVSIMCPFYKHENSQMVYCEGVNEDTTLHLAFADKKLRDKYKDTYCCGDFRKCLIAQMLDKKYK